MADSVDELITKGMKKDEIFVLIDGPYLPRTLSIDKKSAEAVVKGDSKCSW